MVISSTVFNVPGVYVSQNTGGVIPQALATHSTVYMMGYSNQAGAPVEQKTFVANLASFVNLFGTASYSYRSAMLFFNQFCGSGFYFINVKPRAYATATLTAPSTSGSPATVTAGQVYSLTLDTAPGYTVSYTTVAGDTLANIVAQLVTNVNYLASHLATATAGTAAGTVVLRFTSNNTLTVTGSSNITVGTTTAAASYPTVSDVNTSMNATLLATDPQGFIIAPEFFLHFSSADSVTLANQMSAIASEPGHFWVAIADCSYSTATTTTGAGAVNLALAEIQGIASPYGHLAYYFPMLTDLDNVTVPCSAAVAAIALLRQRTEGYVQPPAGVNYPVSGVQGVTFETTGVLQGQLNPANVNVVRHLPSQGGVFIWGMRTASTNPYYKWVATRVILNVLAGTLRSSFDTVLFSLIDGIGALQARIVDTATQICEDLRLAGALYGATPDQAYNVVCNGTNNNPTDINNGIIRLDVYVIVSPSLEVLAINLVQTPVGTVLTNVATSGSATNTPFSTTGASVSSALV